MRPRAPDTIELDYAAPERRSLVGRLGWVAMSALLVYFVISLVTLPFLDALWFGELPVLALPQLPKTLLAGWLRTGVVMPVIRAAGLSSGSFSPDYLLARPYALAIAYGLVVGPVLGVSRWCERGNAPSRRWVWAILIAAVADYGTTLWLAGGPGLSIY